LKHFQNLIEADAEMQYGDLAFVRCRPYTKARILGTRRDNGETEREDLLFLLDTGGQHCRIDLTLPFLQDWNTGKLDFGKETGLGGMTTQTSLVTEEYRLMFGKTENKKPLFKCQPKFTWSKRNIIGSKIFHQLRVVLKVDYHSEIIELIKM